MLWQIIMLLIGIFCLAYYVILRIHTGRKDSTFLPFWRVTGFLFVILGIIFLFVPEKAQNVIGFLGGMLGIFFVIIEVLILAAMFRVPENGIDYIIVLGAQVRGQKITDSLLRRLDKAFEYMEKNPKAKVIVSGGQGKGEDITEAQAMAEYLEERGIGCERIFKEDRSTSTQENMRYSRIYIPDTAKPIGVVTNNFHMFRSLWIGRREGYKNLRGIVATTNRIVLLNYMVREFFALIHGIFKRILLAFEVKGGEKNL